MKARELAMIDLDAAVAYETKHTLLYLIERKHQFIPRRLKHTIIGSQTIRRELP